MVVARPAPRVVVAPRRVPVAGAMAVGMVEGAVIASAVSNNSVSLIIVMYIIVTIYNRYVSI